MKRIFLFFALCLCSFLSAFAQTGNTKWWESEFVIGSFIDPPVMDISDSTIWRNNISLALDAGFNMMTGHFAGHRNGFSLSSSYKEAVYGRLKEICPNYKILLTLDKSKEPPYDGYNLVDEPPYDSAIANSYLSNIPYNSVDLYFINLCPCYMRLKEGQTYESYLDLYLHHNTPLQVACFDNYWPTGYFTNGTHGGYFYNLALMRVKADSANHIPLWSYINTCQPEIINKHDSIWQSSALRLGAFAPVAYGAKGLMYFNYDSLHPNTVRRDTVRAGIREWVNDMFYFYFHPSKLEDTFIGHLRNGNAFDVAVKRDDDLGTWYIKYDENRISHDVDKTLGWYGHKDNVLPFLFYRPDLNRDVIAGLLYNGSLLLTDTLSGWKHNIYLSDTREYWLKNIVIPKVSSFSIDGSNVDFCIVRNALSHDSLYIYRSLDMSRNTDTICVTQKIPIQVGERVFQLVRDADDLYFVTRDSVNTSNPGDDIYKLYQLYEDAGNITVRAETIKLKYVPDHFWIEKDNSGSIHLYCQGTPHSEEIYSGEISWSQTGDSLNVKSEIGDALYRDIVGLRRYDNSPVPVYDRFGIWDKRQYDEALVDGTGAPTQRYHMVRENNLYIRNVLSPVILGADWKGAWHTAPQGVPMHAKDTIGGYVKMLESGSDSILKYMDSNLIAGKFDTDSCLYYFFVDKGGEDRDSCMIKLNVPDSIVGRGGVSLLPRLHAGRSTLAFEKQKETPSDSVWKICWSEMLGGEGVMLKVMKQTAHPQTGYASRHRGRDLDGDDRDDVILRAPSQISVGYSENSGWDTGTGTLTQISAGGSGREYVEGDWDGDGEGDVCWLDRSLKKFVIVTNINNGSNSTTMELPYDSIDSGTTPFCADYDGDGKTDVCFRSGELGNVFLDVSSNDFGDIDEKYYIYGTSSFTLPAQGDYDGDGKDDIALLTRDGRFLIDYARNGLGMWDARYELPSEVRSVLPNMSNDNIQVGDMDGDGLADVTMSSIDSNAVLTITGSDGFARARSVNLGSSDQSDKPLTCGDYDGDGVMERAKYDASWEKLLILNYGTHTDAYDIDFTTQ